MENRIPKIPKLNQLRTGILQAESYLVYNNTSMATAMANGTTNAVRQYDLLTNCRVRIASRTVVEAPPVRPLPADVLALTTVAQPAAVEPKPYDFAVGTYTNDLRNA
jgi:hypothetical protein